MSTTNNSADIIVKGRILQERDDSYPDPSTLPLPSQEPRIAEVTLSELVPGKYVSATARVVYLRTIEKQDALGTRVIFSGILEDSTFKVPFVSHRISYPLIRNCVYKFQSAYVHEFASERSLLLVITEHTKIQPKDIEDFREYIWKPKIDTIKRPVKSLALQGVISTVHGNSGLVKRCNKCKSIFYDDACPNKCPKEEGWGWDLRVSCRLYDGSGSMKMVLTKDIASKVLQRNLAELVLLASSKGGLPRQNNNSQTPSSEITLKIPDSIDVIEAVTEDASPSSFRSSDKVIITDGRNLVYFPPNEEDEQKFSEYVKRSLQASNIEDRKIIRRLIEKALDIGIRKVTGMRKMQGIYLLEEPVPLYRCEQAKLYLGFSIQVSMREEKEEGDDSGRGGDEPEPEPEPEPDPDPDPDPGLIPGPEPPGDPCEENPGAEGCTPEPPIDPCIEDPTAEGCEPELPICKPCPPGQICPDVCEPLTPPICEENPSLPECGPVPAPPPGRSCHPSYPDTCIPGPPPNLNCGDVSARNFKVVGSDPHGFDGDNDGIGCEGSGNGGGGNGRGCDPSYPEDCIPPLPPDLNCGDSGVPINVKVVPPDPHRLDGDKDGVGCEGSGSSGGGGNGNGDGGGSTSANECQGQADCFRGTVTEIVDGDTLDVNNVRVRLALINTPERGENGYTEAIDFVQSVCGIGTTALVDEDDGQKEGSFDRMIGLVYCGNDNINNKKSLNELLLERGYAVIYQDFCGISEFSSAGWAQSRGC